MGTVYECIRGARLVLAVLFLIWAGGILTPPLIEAGRSAEAHEALLPLLSLFGLTPPEIARGSALLIWLLSFLAVGAAWSICDRALCAIADFFRPDPPAP